MAHESRGAQVAGETQVGKPGDEAVRMRTAGYRRWRAQLFTKAQHARVREAVARGHLLAAWQGVATTVRFTPWAAQSVASSFAFAARGYAALLRLVRSDA